MYSVNSLVLEVTRRCNMRCAHCLRGNAEDQNMNPKIIEKLNQDIDLVYCTTFSGGEPTLNPEIIAEYNRVFGKKTYSFFIATNGKVYSQEIMSTLVELHSNCEDSDFCSLAVSRDQFRDETDTSIIKKYKAFSFFNEQAKNGKIRYIIDSGMAIENGIGNTDPRSVELVAEDNYIEDIYINVYGDVCVDCDLSYEDQKKSNIGNILKEDLKTIIEREIERKIERKVIMQHC